MNACAKMDYIRNLIGDEFLYHAIIDGLSEETLENLANKIARNLLIDFEEVEKEEEEKLTLHERMFELTL